MADTRGLAVNRDIYNFETMMYRVYDNIPAKHKHTLSALALQSTLEKEAQVDAADHHIEMMEGQADA